MRRFRDDRGASVIFALVFITVGAVGLVAVLSFAYASMRTTIQLRDQAATVAAADGAAKAAMNSLRQGTNTYTSGNCFGSGAGASNTLALNNFYTPPGAASATSAAVTCAPDNTHSVLDPGVQVSPINTPLNAILTLATGGETGINVSVSGNRTLRVHGDIFSHSAISVPQGTLQTDTSIRAEGSCTPSGSVVATVSKTCGIAAGDPHGVDPNYAPVGGSTAPQSVPICSGHDQKVTFTPGLYDNTDLAALNNITSNSGCKNSILWFQPGTYYFNWTGTWLIDSGYVVGGTPTSPLVAGTPPTMPGSCKSPIPPNPVGSWVHPGPNEGVQFVFAGTSQMDVKAAKMELCGSYSPITPPIAVYGLKSAVGSVPAQSGCITTPGGCVMLQTEQSPNNAVFIQGTTYTPRALLNVQLNNNTAQVFRWGVIARALVISPTGSANLTGPVIQVPDTNVSGGMISILYLIVYLCPNSGTCTVAPGKQRLLVKVAIQDPSGVPIAGQREVTVYTWSIVR